MINTTFQNLKEKMGTYLKAMHPHCEFSVSGRANSKGLNVLD